MSKILENIETPIEENGMGNILEDLTYKVPIEIPQRVNPFCVISKDTFGEYAVRDIQTNSAWSENPYEDYAIVPDEMVLAIQETRGFCDIELNEDGTEVVSFKAREIPDIPEPPNEPTVKDDSVWDEMALAIEEGVNEV